MKEQENTRIELIEETTLKDVSVCFELKFLYVFLSSQEFKSTWQKETGSWTGNVFKVINECTY